MYQRTGFVAALVLDGGGSVTYAARIESSDTPEVCNAPSDGSKREISSSILIVSTAEATGVFDHTAQTPNNELYTSSSEVQLVASSVEGLTSDTTYQVTIKAVKVVDGSNIYSVSSSSLTVTTK